MIKMKDYLTAMDMKEYTQLSRQNGKIAVITDRCGSGKSTARNHYVCENFHEAPRLVVEKIPSCNELKADLLKINPKLEGLIGVYHSDGKTSDDISELYDKNRSKPISIITHARLSMDNVQRWMFTDNSIANYCQSIIIDEMPNDQVFTVNIMTETILDKTRRLSSDLGTLIDQVLFGKRPSLEVKSILNTLATVDHDLRNYVSRLIECKTRLADAGIVTHSSSYSGLKDLEEMYIYKKLKQETKDLLINRFMYQFHMIYFALLSGRYKEVKGDYLACSVLSPLYAWNALHGVGTLILDATGELDMYPDDLCHIVEPKVKPRSDTIQVHRVNGKTDKRFWKPTSKEDAKSLSNHFYLLVKELLESTCINDNVVYLCTWMDQAQSQIKRDYIHNESGTTSLVVNSALVDTSFRQEQHISKLYREYVIDPKPRPGRWFKKGEINAESAVSEAAKALKLYTNIDKEIDLHLAIQRGIDPSSDEFGQLSADLESQIKLYISHFGKTKGENRYSHCNTVIILGDHYLPQRVYDEREIYLKRPLREIDIIKSVAATTIQEIERSKSRRPDLSEPVNCYLMSSLLVFKEIRDYFGWNSNGHLYQGKLSGTRSADIYDELNKLTSSQKTKMVKINDYDPNLFEGKSVLLNTADIGDIIGSRANNVIRSLEGICTKSRFNLKQVTSNQKGQKVGNRFELQLK